VRTFVSIDTESGIIRRYSESASLTHEAGLTHDPEDGDKTRAVIEGFRVHPHSDFRIPVQRIRTFEDALIEQRQRFAARDAQLLLSHRDEA
jgi:hypothetical protein